MRKIITSRKEYRGSVKRCNTFFVVLVVLLLIPTTASLGNTLEKTDSYLKQVHSGDWTEQGKLMASDPDVLSFFGLDLSFDGEWALFGAHGDDDKGVFSGAAYMFKKNGTAWVEEQKLLASDGEADDLFGSCVCLDGEYAIIGKADTDSPGAAYIFKNTDGTWVEAQILTASDGVIWDEFGNAVSIDGDYALVGAQFDDDIGSAYIFKREGTLWTEEAKLVPSEGELYDCFGSSVALQGDYAVVGALNHDDSTGAVYIFKREGTTWTEDAIVIGSDSQVQDRFGLSVEIQDGRVVAGARLCNNEFRGAVYIFKKEDGTWKQEQKLVPSDSEEAQCFGQALAIDGDYLFVGAPDEKLMTGSAYVFTYNGDTWTEIQKLTASDPAMYDEFGCAISLQGNTAMIGKYAEDNYTGSVYVFGTEFEEDEFFITISGGLGFSATIYNNGTSGATNVSVMLHVEGGFLRRINKTITDTVNIPPRGVATISTGVFLGVGRVTITVRANVTEKTGEGTQFIIFSRVKSNETWNHISSSIFLE